MSSSLRIQFTAVFTLAFLLAGLTPAPPVAAQTLTATERAQLEQQLGQVQAEQAQAQNDLATAQSKSHSLQNDINLLAAKVRTEQLNIQAKNLLIKTLGDNITTKQAEIASLDAQIAKNEQSISDIFRVLQKTEDTSLLESLLINSSLSQLFDYSINLISLQQGIDTLSAQLTSEEASSTAEKATLVDRQNAAVDARYTIQQEQKSLQSNQAQQQQLLSISKNNEKAYSALVTAKKQEADAISAKLFILAGGSNPIPFGKAYQYAVAASNITGVDPAFLLAILTQESNLGTNQGMCFLRDTATGTGVGAHTGRTFENVMSPGNIPDFMTITSTLGIDPFNTVVSCPQSIGWGGAMGPAQFEPSTWMLFSNRVANALGFTSMANPWNPQDAFMASALYLSDLGAGSGTYTAESNAACRYYSGRTCAHSSLVASYGRSVMSLASTIQNAEIDKLTGI